MDTSPPLSPPPSPSPRRRRRTNKTAILCLPSLRSSSSSTCSPKTHHRVSPTSLLERFRGAVFRLMMISALSNPSSSSSSSVPTHSPRVKTRVKSRPPPSDYQYHQDSHNSEAVADCIEFIKKTSAADGDDQEEGGGGGRCDYSAGHVRCCSSPGDSLVAVPVIM